MLSGPMDYMSRLGEELLERRVTRWLAQDDWIAGVSLQEVMVMVVQRRSDAAEVRLDFVPKSSCNFASFSRARFSPLETCSPIPNICAVNIVKYFPFLTLAGP